MRRRATLIAFIYVAVLVRMPAPVTFDWLVNGPDGEFNNAANWAGNAVPPVNGTAQPVLPFAGHAQIETINLPTGNVALDSIKFLTDDNFLSYTGSSYHFSTAGSTTLSLSNGITKSLAANPAYVNFLPGISIDIAANQTWSVNSVTVNGAIGGAGSLHYAPVDWGGSNLNGSLYLYGPGNFTGGFSASNAIIHLGHASALAGGSVSLYDSSLTLDIAGDYVFSGPVTLNSEVGFWSFDASQNYTYRLNGPITLAGHTILESVQQNRVPVYLAGTIGQTNAGTGLILTGGAFVFSGNNSTGAYTGGTNVQDRAALIFATGDSVPATGQISASYSGYVGAAFTSDVQSKLIARLDTGNFSGTLGLDSDPLGPELVFSQALDVSSLTGFLGLGSVTRAKLTGPLTIGAGQDYRFGGGGGTLTVASALTQSGAGVRVDGPGDLDPLTVVLQGANTFTGNVELGYGALIFDGASALPAGKNVTFNFNHNVAYAGYTENFGGTPNAFLARLVNPGNASSVAGIDSANAGSPRTVSDPVDLSLGGTRTNPYYLGTATKVTLTGTLTAPAAGGAGPLYLTGVKGGHLVVNSVIGAPTTSLFVGLDQLLGSEPGTVELNGTNTFTGGTTFHSGQLLVGNVFALGTGPLRTAGSSSLDRTLAATSNLTLANAIDVDQDLTVGLPASPVLLTLSGSIRGDERLRYVGAAPLVLSGHVSVDELEVDTATGGVVVSGSLHGTQIDLIQGDLTLHSSAWTRYLSVAPDTTLQLGAAADLLLDSDGLGEGSLEHRIDGTITGSGSLTLDYGDGLFLPGANAFTGGLTLVSGRMRLGHSSALGSGTLHVYGNDDHYYPDVGFDVGAPGLVIGNAIDLQGRLELGADYYFDYSNSPTYDFALAGTISGPGSLAKSSDRTVTLSGANTFEGGVSIFNGEVVFAHNQAAGTGVLWLEPLGIGSFADARFTTASPVIGGLGSYGGGEVTLAAGSTLRIEQGENLDFDGVISGAGARLEKAGGARLMLFGANTFTGGIEVESGSLVFGSEAALANLTGIGANALTVLTGGYAGLADDEYPTASFLAKFDLANTTGSLGFDAPFQGTTFTFSDPVNLTGFQPSVRLGSASSARLTTGAIITPVGGANAPYQFGGGGGVLQVSSALTGARAVNVTSPSAHPLTLWLDSGANDYTGGTFASHSAVVFSAGALPATGQLSLGPGGYLGTADAYLPVATFLGRLAPGTNQGAVGFDVPFGFFDRRYIGSAIDLSGFPGGGSLTLATATHLTVAGPLTPAGGSSVHRFAGYKGGSLTVLTPLTGGASVVIGDADTLGYFGDPIAEYQSSVILSGHNTYTGGTTLYSGLLMVGPHGLGTGALTVQPNNVVVPGEGTPLPSLSTFVDDISIPNNIVLNASLNLSSDTGRMFTLSGVISGSGALELDDDDSQVILAGANTYTGGTYIHEGQLLLGPNGTYGTGAIHLGGDAEIGAVSGSRTLPNNLVVHDDYLRFTGGGALTIDGGIQLNSGDTEIRWSGDFDRRPPLVLNGAISGGGRIEFDTEGVVIINGGISDGAEVFIDDSTRVIFASVGALPPSGRLDLDGSATYLGLQTPTAGLQSQFLDRFSPESYGTVGLDSPVGGPVQTFTANLDFRSIAGVSLGSATSAIFTGTITPAYDDYVLGGGGGHLTVASNLTDDDESRWLYVRSHTTSPTIVRLTGTNTSTGGTNVQESALIFGTAAALSPQTVISMTGELDYAGYDTAAITPAAFIAAFRDDLWGGTIGFDSTDVNSPRTITSPDISGFELVFTPNIALGTASAAIIDGTIALNAAQPNYRFTAYADGHLTVNSTLSGSRGLRLLAVTPQDGLVEVDPTIRLNAANTHAGDTVIDGVRVVLGHTGALGTGTVQVADDYYDNRPAILEFTNAGGTVTNAFNINYYPLVFDGSANTTLSGNYSAYDADFIKDGPFTLTLTGNNSIDYGDYRIREGTVVFAANGAAGGYGAVVLEGAGATASFTSAAPSTGGLSSEPGVATTVSLAGGTVLTLYTSDDYSYAGLITGAGGLIKSGGGTQELSGANSYSGGTTIADGRLVVGHTSALGTGTVTLDGGELVAEPGIVPGNAISFGASGGLLSGNGTFGGAVTLGQQAGLAPGQSVGTLTFNSGVTFGSGAFLEFEVQDPDGLPGTGYDTLAIAGALTIDATAGDKFTIKLISLDANGNNGNIDFNPPNPLLPFTWQIASAGSVAGFDAAKFSINTSSWNTNFPDADLWVSSNANGLFLNFKPIPEPSTYALFAVGAGLAWAARRRRR